MSKQFGILLVVGIVLAIGVSAVGAQGNGNGVCDPQQSICSHNQQSTGMGMGNGNANMGRGHGNANRGSAQNGSGLFPNLPAASVSELPQDVIDLMVKGWLDEQHAYAVYQGVIDQLGAVRPFVNIQRAEAQHIAAWEYLFSRYDIAMPEVPTFDVPTFSSVTDACQLGADAEVANFDLYDTMLTTFKPYPDIYQVASTLRDVSEYNHLPAFQRCSG